MVVNLLHHVCLPLSLSHRVFITNLQKEIEKQTGYRSTRKRRSESQYDYEVYHSLEEVDVKPIIYQPICHFLLLCSLMQPQSKQTSSPTSAPNTPFHMCRSHILIVSHADTLILL